jgi:hypothetical protein
VLGHGFSCDQRVWRYMLPDLAATQQVVSAERPGAATIMA